KRDLAGIAVELFAEDRLVDRVRVAAGEPRIDWIGAIKFAMGQLARLDHGSVVLGDRRFSIEGEAASAEAYADYLDANEEKLPSGLVLENATVSPPTVSPFRFVAARTPEAITLDGHVSSKGDRDSLVAEVKSKFGGLRLVDNLVFASGAPENFVR